MKRSQKIKKLSQTFKTESGIEFETKDLLKVSVDEVEPWDYANRHETDFGNILELAKSIEKIGQQNFENNGHVSYSVST